MIHHTATFFGIIYIHTLYTNGHDVLTIDPISPHLIHPDDEINVVHSVITS
jgi:hypothetical protein